MAANKIASTWKMPLTVLAGFLIACAGPRDSAAPPAAPGGDLAAASGEDAQDPVLQAGQGEAENKSREGQAVHDAGTVKQERGDTDDDGNDPEALFAEYEQLLQQREQQLRGAGIALAHLGDASSAPRTKSTDAVAPNQPGAGTSATRSQKKPKKQKRKSSTSKPSTKSSTVGGVSMCVQICSLKQATCELEQKICSLASRHHASERYANVCQRAREDCAVATEACTKCE